MLNLFQHLINSLLTFQIPNQVQNDSEKRTVQAQRHAEFISASYKLVAHSIDSETSIRMT